MKGVLGLPGSRPFIKTVRWYQASAILKAFAESRFERSRFAADAFACRMSAAVL